MQHDPGSKEWPHVSGRRPAEIRATGRGAAVTLEPDGLAALGRGVQRFDRPRVADGVLAAEEQLRLAADRLAHVLELEPVRVGRLELDPLRSSVAPHFDHRRPPVPGIVEDDRALLADALELVWPRERRAAVEEPEDLPREP